MKKLYALRLYILFFLMYAVLGWIYEVFLEVVVYKWEFSNRGFLFGPYCPIYGFGALLFIFSIYPLIKNKKLLNKLLLVIPVFIGCMAAATLLELITSYIMEFITGDWPWQTYADYDFNFQARIALSTSLRFGLGGVIFLYFIQPLFEKITSKLSDRQITGIAVMISGILFFDLLYTLFIR